MNYKKKNIKNHSNLFDLGLNNSALVNLTSTVVISSDPKYIDTDGVTGKISEKQSEAFSIAKDYSEMLKNPRKQLIQIGPLFFRNY